MASSPEQVNEGNRVMPKVTNISTGPRGAYLKGALIMAEPGESIEADDYAKEWFKGSSKSADDAGEGADKPLAKMNKTELLEAAKAEGVEVEEGATKSQIVAAIEAKRPQS